VTSSGPNINDAGDKVNQVELYCRTKDGINSCFIRENKTINHSQDMFVECQKYDPTNPTKPDGTPQF